MAKYELVFTSVATVVVEASSQKEADLMGAEYDVSKIDWAENVDFDYAEKLAGEEL